MDAARLEILARKVSAVADEMALTLKRTARSAFVKEGGDFGVGVADLAGDIFAWPSDSTVSGVSSILYPMRAVIERFPDLAPGDVIGTNDAYTSDGLATHLPDYHLVRPYFHGGRVVAYGWCFCHLNDVGGRVPGSVSPTNTEIFQEGMRVPPMKLVKGGVIDGDWMALFMANTRSPDLNVGDFKALLAALEAGARRTGRLIDRHGVDAFLGGQEALLAYAEAKARAVVRSIPEGTYEFWDYVDDDMVTRIPFRIRLKVTFREGGVNIDLTDTDPQVPGSLNYPSMGRLRSGLTRRLVTFICTRDRTIPFNAGIFRPFSVTNPPGHVLHAEFPNAISSRVDTTRRLNDVMNGVLLQAAPETMAAPAGGASVTLVYSEPDPGGRNRTLVNVVQSLRGGMGAFRGSDGVDARDVSYVNMKNQRLETVEAHAGVRFLEYEVRPDSGGPGQWRGGVGQSLTFEARHHGGTLIVQGMDRLRFPGWGVFGGRPAASFRIVRNRGLEGEQELSRLDRLDLGPGERVTVMMPGGSGYGDPLARDPASVLEDLRLGLVTVEGARADYGVVVRDGEVDAGATARAREARPPENLRRDFDFGPEREAWEAVFDDATVRLLNRNLYRLPRSIRLARRQWIIAQTVPDLPAAGQGLLSEAVGDPDAARARLARAMETVFGADYRSVA